MEHEYFMNKILACLDQACKEVDRDSYNLTRDDHSAINVRINELKKFICDMYAVKCKYEV